MTLVHRLQENGILRLGSMKSGFRYRYAAGGRPGLVQRARIRDLRVPPAWQQVAIARSPRATVQAVGQDRAGRWQYLYHERAVARRERRKAERLVAFIRALPRLRARVARDLTRGDLDREHVLACILRILSTCFLRPGSEEYASENGSFGIATLRTRHVRVRGSRVMLQFNGKSGRKGAYEIADRRVATIVRALLRIPGRRVFRFRDEHGELRDVRRHHINAYIKEAMGGAFSAKDFRTWAGTVTCACGLARAGVDPGASPRQVRRTIAAAVKETAEALGNTPAVSRSSYISPAVIRAFENGLVLTGPTADPSILARHRGARLHRCERGLLRLLESRGRARPRRPAVARLAA
jgi:DNA topoisomerase-1